MLLNSTQLQVHPIMKEEIPHSFSNSLDAISLFMSLKIHSSFFNWHTQHNSYTNANPIWFTEDFAWFNCCRHEVKM